jgi:hypothetical protein
VSTRDEADGLRASATGHSVQEQSRALSQPLVSIVTPSYNQGQFIRETIESVLGQDYPYIEYWVIDGGSTDDTVAILREYESDPRFQWLSERDRGQADAINKGWARCHGEILAWLNSDDIFLDRAAISHQVAALAQHPQAGLVYGIGYYVDPSGSILRIVPTRPYSYSTLIQGNYIAQPTVFLRREVVQQVGPIDLRFKFAMDYRYWLRCTAYTDFHFVETPIATYRLHTSSKTVSEPIEINLEALWAVCAHFAREGRATIGQGQKRRIMARLLLTLAARAIRLGDVRYARQLIGGARQLNLLDIRYLYLPIVYIAHRHGWDVEMLLAEKLFFLLQPRLKH